MFCSSKDLILFAIFEKVGNRSETPMEHPVSIPSYLSINSKLCAPKSFILVESFSMLSTTFINGFICSASNRGSEFPFFSVQACFCTNRRCQDLITNSR